MKLPMRPERPDEDAALSPTAYADYSAALESYCTSLESMRGGEWQDISTAPKPLRSILLYEPRDMRIRVTDGNGKLLTKGHISIGSYQDGQWKNYHSMSGSLLKPTHWLPLPPAPEKP